MAKSMVLLVSFAAVLAAVLAQDTRGNVFTECLGWLSCDRTAPVCGFNGTHCWNSINDCERKSFNCLQFFKTDFEQVEKHYCGQLTVGGIKPCCMKKNCTGNKDPICGQALKRTHSKCRWFRNRCELENLNCIGETEYIEAQEDLCNFDFDSEERYCSHVIVPPIGGTGHEHGPA